MAKRKYPNRPDWRNLPRAPGAGRKPRYPGGAMVQISVRVPQAVLDWMVEQYGSQQGAIDALVIEAAQE